MAGLSEKELQEVALLNASEREAYENLRHTEISHRTALDLIAKWKEEDAYREGLGTPGYDAGIEIGGTSPYPPGKSKSP